ncbi:GIY-YIG nuclease family protein [Hyalangium sp.]|uniref:GIY-YIG nuclease family protein n=1 Tax=Hyalangium sp. TaxID=2028555 RepID=UPI002D5847DE|nr:GIY-YIG nuclease family protein [Hyalangium sp.]HYI02612.1 GIY-YIG nuclease family protein [Hyalangium sp.]
MPGRSVRLFLVDGTPQGLRTAEVGMWTGQAMVAPRTELTRLGKREEIQNTGVYVLVGPSEDQSSETAVYVGEADDVWARLTNHASNKDFWTWVVVFVSKDDNLTKAHVRWLEARLVQEIRAAKLVHLMNGNEPGGGRLPEADEADMETFLENVRLLLPVLGLNVFTSVTGNPKSGLRLRLTWDNATADCIVKEGVFIVQKGSTARKKNVDSLQPSYQNMRKRLTESEVLIPQGPDLLVFTQDFVFESPTAAAVAVAGTSLNGRDMWKVASTGESYKEWQQRQVAGAPGAED